MSTSAPFSRASAHGLKCTVSLPPPFSFLSALHPRRTRPTLDQLLVALEHALDALLDGLVAHLADLEDRLALGARVDGRLDGLGGDVTSKLVLRAVGETPCQWDDVQRLASARLAFRMLAIICLHHPSASNPASPSALRTFVRMVSPKTSSLGAAAAVFLSSDAMMRLEIMLRCALLPL